MKNYIYQVDMEIFQKQDEHMAVKIKSQHVNNLARLSIFKIGMLLKMKTIKLNVNN